MRSFILFVLSILMIQMSQAQNQFSKIINDPNVTWASEYLIDIDPQGNRDQNKAKDFGSASGTILKSTALPIEGDDIYPCNNWQYDNSLVKILIQNRTNMTVYQDHQLTKAFSMQEAAKIGSSVDTLISYSPETFEEIRSLIINEIDPENIIGFRQYGMVFYDKNQAQFIVKPLSIAPILQEYGDSGQPTVIRTLFWVPIEETNKTNLDSKNVQWVSRVLHHVGNDSEIAPKKQLNRFGESWDLLIKHLNANYDKRKIYSVFQILGDRPLAPKEIQTLGSSVDTVISFDPKTFEEIVNVVISELHPEDIKEMRIVQDWIWDKKKKRLFVRYLGYAPIIRRYDMDGQFLNSGAMFYVRMPGVK